MKISTYPYYFTLILILGLIALFFGHSYILESGDFDAAGLQLVKSYVLNAIMAAIVFFTIFIFRDKYRDLLGFFFLGGSLVKFTLFFIFLYPTYHQDGVLERAEFLAFFIPYGFSLALETYFLVKLLNTVR